MRSADDTAPAGPAVRSGPHADGRRASPRPVREPTAHRLYARLAWTTLDGLPLVDPRRVLGVEAQIIALCRRLDVEPVDVRARPDRLDLLVRFKPVQCLADVASAVKAGSADHLERAGTPIRWGRGVALTSVAPDAVRSVVRRMAVMAEPDGSAPTAPP